MKTIFLTGVVNGITKEQALAKFKTFKDKLDQTPGNIVFSPIGLTDFADENMSKAERLKNDIRSMLDADEVHLLPDWHDSLDAQLIRDTAVRLGMTVVYH